MKHIVSLETIADRIHLEDEAPVKWTAEIVQKN